MSQVTDQIMHVIIRKPGCLLEELVRECPGLTWNQVFLRTRSHEPYRPTPTHGEGLGVYALTRTTACEPSVTA